MAWRLAICEDNEHDRSQIVAAVGQWSQIREVPLLLDVFSHPRALIGAFQRFDAYMLDIFMPNNKAEGWSLAEDIRNANKNAPIVFITASEDFALPALNLQRVVGYVKKPFSEIQIHQVLDHLHEYLSSSEEDSFISQAIFRNQFGERYSATVRIPHTAILYLRSSLRSNYVQINGQEEPQLRQTIKGLLEILPQIFQRADRSLIINLSRVYQLQQDAIVFNDPARTRINISNSCRTALDTAYHGYRSKNIL